MSQTVPQLTRAAVLERSQFRCERCGVRKMQGLHMSHRIPRGSGGAKGARGKPHSRLSNVNALCSKCHLSFVEANPTLAYDEGWKVRRGTDPMSVPIRMWEGWFIIDDTGARQMVMAPVTL